MIIRYLRRFAENKMFIFVWKTDCDLKSKYEFTVGVDDPVGG